MIEQIFLSVWFADEKRNRSLIKSFTFSEAGSLKTKPDFLEFQGWRINLQITNIKTISIVRQQVPWISLLIVSALALVYCAVMANGHLGEFLFFISTFLLFDILAVVVGYNTKWVKVEYTNEQNKICRAFSADGSLLGWG